MSIFVSWIKSLRMYKVKIIDVRQWKKEIHINTSGTRNKHILTSPTGPKYFFKKSLLKPNKDYKYEFWSEVIASQVAYLLNFNVIQYNVAYFGKEIGCISKSIVNTNKEELSEGYGYIVEKYPDFQDNFKKSHSFQKIVGALCNLKLRFLIPNVIEMIIFDGIIGNTDRHSENWAIIISNKEINEMLNKIEHLPWYRKFKLQIQLFIASKGEFTLSKANDRIRKNICKFSPLYDNGSSLARELNNDKIIELMNDEDKLLNFINRGKPDIRWNDKHLNHFELIKAIRLDYPQETNKVIQNLKSKYNKNVLINIVKNIDRKLPEQFMDYQIPDIRKEFIIKYIDSRVNIILNDYEQV